MVMMKTDRQRGIERKRDRERKRNLERFDDVLLTVVVLIVAIEVIMKERGSVDMREKVGDDVIAFRYSE